MARFWRVWEIDLETKEEECIAATYSEKWAREILAESEAGLGYDDKGKIEFKLDWVSGIGGKRAVGR